MQFHYADQDNQVVGPVSEDDLRVLLRQGTITADTNVFPEGSDWQPYRTLMALPPPPPPQTLALRTMPVTPVMPTMVAAPVAATRACPYCAEEIALQAKKCKHCGEIVDLALRAAEEAKEEARRANSKPNVYMNAGGASSSASASVAASPQIVVVGGRKSGLVAALLNLFLPGLGYMYCGRVGLGLFVLLLTIGLVTSGVGAVLLVVLYPVFLIDGFLAAGRANRRVLMIQR